MIVKEYIRNDFVIILSYLYHNDLSNIVSYYDENKND